MNLVLLIIIVFAQVDCNNKNDKQKETKDKRMSISSENYQKLIKSFKKESTDFNQVLDYPVYFAGAFIDSTGMLIINITGDSITVKRDIIERIGNQHFLLQEKKYSSRELIQIMDTINKFMLDSTNQKIILNNIGIHTVVLSDQRNKIIVRLAKLNAESIKAFKDIIYCSPAIEFEQSPGLASLD